MEFKDVPTPLDLKFFPDHIVKSLEGDSINRGQFVSEHTRIDEVSNHGDCVFCGGNLSPKPSADTGPLYSGQDFVNKLNCTLMRNDKCDHKFHAGCFDSTDSKKCPVCNAYCYSDLSDLLCAIEIKKHLARLDNVDPDDLLEHLSWIHSGNPIVLGTSFFVFCILTVAYKMQNSVTWEFSAGRTSRPIGYWGGIEKHQDGRFVVEAIIDAIKELESNEAEEPSILPSGRVQDFLADDLRRDGQGNKVLRLAPDLLGGRLSEVWKKVMLKIVHNESLKHEYACFYYGAQVLVLAAEHYLHNIEENREDSAIEDDWYTEESWDCEEGSRVEDSASEGISHLDLNEEP